MLLTTVRFQVLSSSSSLSTKSVKAGVVIPALNLSTGSLSRLYISEFSERDKEESKGCLVVSKFVNFDTYLDTPFAEYSFEFGGGINPYAYYTTCNYDSSTRLLEVSLHCNEALVSIAKNETKQKLKSLKSTTTSVAVEKQVTFKKTIQTQSCIVTLIRGTDGVWRDNTGTLFKRTPIIKIMATYLRDGFEIV
jgi:hypothetical protein